MIELLWECTICKRKFIDADLLVPAWMAEAKASGYSIEAENHWLGPTEPVCTKCAAEVGIPSIDEEEDA